jgi:hypothetical protein
MTTPLTGTITIQPNTRTATQIVWASDPPVSVLIVNTDLVNTIYLSESDAARASDIAAGTLVSLGPNGSLVLDGTRDFFVVITASTAVSVSVIAGGVATFLGLTQGQGSLVIPSIFSPNFITGVSGWTIKKDGSAEFNNLTIRGTFLGTRFIFNVNGLFFYSGTPGPTTLFVSVCGAVVTDPFSTSCSPGIFLYGPNGSSISLVDVSGQPTLDLTPASQTHMTVIPSLAALAINAGLVNEYLLTTLSSGQDNNLDNAAVQLFSESNDSTVAATVALVAAGVRVVNVFKTGVQFQEPIVATLGSSVSNQTIITTDTWNSITLDANWSTLAGQPVPSYRLGIEKRVHLEGAAQFNVNINNTNLNGGHPLPTAYRPATAPFLAAAPGSAGLNILTTGVLVAAQGAAATPFCNFCGNYATDL